LVVAMDTSLGVSKKAEPTYLLGVDITDAFQGLSTLAVDKLGQGDIPCNLHFKKVMPGESLDVKDLDGIYSWSVFEHIDRAFLYPIITDFYRQLRSGGVLFIQIEPLYFSPFGSHLQRLVSEPWAHLRYDQESLRARVMEFDGNVAEHELDLAASGGVTEGFKKWLWGEYLSLNQLRHQELTQLLEFAGFQIVRSELGRHPERPPRELVEQYTEDDLRINELRVLARKPDDP